MTLITERFRGAARGMYLRGPYTQAPEGYAKFLVDALVDRSPEIRQRGPITNVTSFPSDDPIPDAQCIASVTNPNGDRRFLFIERTAGTSTVVVTSETATLLNSTTLMDSSVSSSTKTWDVKPNLAGGVWLSNEHFLGEWHGGATYTTGAGGAAARVTDFDSKSGKVTLAGVTLTDNMIGCFLVLTGVNAYLGKIVEVLSSVELMIDPKHQLSGGTFTGQTLAFAILPIRYFIRRTGMGTISCSTTSNVVTGSNTDFIGQGMDGIGAGYGVTGYAWNLYRAKDGQIIGTTVEDSTTPLPTANQIRLTSNAAVNCDNEPWYAFNTAVPDNPSTWEPHEPKHRLASGRYLDPNYIGRRIAVYGNRQWYAFENSVHRPENRAALWFSEKGNPYIVNRDTTIIVAGEDDAGADIINIAGTEGALLIFKTGSTYTLRGDDLENFLVQPLLNDGIVGVGAYAYWNSGVVWVGYKGVYFFDGASVRNLTEDNMGTEWGRIIRNYSGSPTTYTGLGGIRCMVVKNMLWISFPSSIVSGEQPTGDVSVRAIAIDLETEALTMHSTLNFFAGSADLSSTQVYFLQSGMGVCYGTYLQDNVGEDETGSGPRFYLEANTLQSGGVSDKLWFKRFMVRYLAAGTGIDTADSARVILVSEDDAAIADDDETLPGNSTIDVTSSLDWYGVLPGDNEFVRRLRYDRRGRDLRVVIYVPSTHNALKDFRVYDWAVGLKPMREWRI